MDCSTVIVSYNTFDLTREAIHSALASGGSMRHEVIVVDNASPDGSAHRLREAFPTSSYPHVLVIASEENLGFARANNVGAAKATGRVLFFLNPDTVVHGDAIPRLTALLDARPDLGPVGPRVLNTDGTDQPSTWAFSTAAELLRFYFPIGDVLRGRDHRTDAVPATSGPVDVVKGCALAVTRGAFEEVGGWDDSYFMYAEETELCWALRAQGRPAYFLREAVITHHGGQSTQEDYAAFQVRERQSALRFLRRHGSPPLVLLNRVAGALGFAGRAGAYALLARARPAHAEGYRRRGEAASALWRWFAFVYR